jgi:hypothetical protein
LYAISKPEPSIKPVLPEKKLRDIYSNAADETKQQIASRMLNGGKRLIDGEREENVFMKLKTSSDGVFGAGTVIPPEDTADSIEAAIDRGLVFGRQVSSSEPHLGVRGRGGEGMPHTDYSLSLTHTPISHKHHTDLTSLTPPPPPPRYLLLSLAGHGAVNRCPRRPPHLWNNLAGPAQAFLSPCSCLTCGALLCARACSIEL